MTMEFLENAIPGIFVINAITLESSLEDIGVTYVNPSFADLFRSEAGEFVDRPILPEVYWVNTEHWDDPMPLSLPWKGQKESRESNT
ncbi:MAG: hypothetical protein GTO24_09915 [candidate division Zixibacteria bacterium]|nr:hypothetical protein [candidate division Zixibacteria bacterium]